ncbi:hypothetical protein KAS79_01345 [Candidatus Parcubacteria bacterium]|nr:hypothetical protein [Candidatus Parcubacteria bacterium]
MSFRKKITILIIVLTLGLGIVGYWEHQKNLYSKDILKLEILGPETAETGEEIEYTVKYKNNGNVRLEDAKLIFEYPEYSLIKQGDSLRVEQELDDIYPGEEKTFHFECRLLGKEKEMKTAKAFIFYRPKDLKARYESKTSFSTKIEFIPLTFEFDLSSKVDSMKEISFALNYFSNIDYSLTDLRVKIEYPSGFEFLESQPQSLEKIEWEIGSLNKAEGGRIKIKGKLQGEIGDQKTFRAILGIWQEGEFILLKEAVKTVEIIEPSLYINQEINGSSQYTAAPGDFLHYEIFFKNIGEEAFEKLFLVVKLEGKPFDLESLKTSEGEYKSGDNSIIWDWRKVSKLRFLDAQEEGVVEFWVNLKEEWQVSGPQDKNSFIKNTVILSQTKEEFKTKINSKIELTQKGYFEQEFWENSGTIPPKVGETTAYTILWQAKNFYNDAENVKVKAILPQEVKLTGEIFPKESKLSFDFKSRELVWDIGDLKAGEENPVLAFQVVLTPSSQQKGQTPSLIGEARIICEDQWTEQILESNAETVNTTLPDDETVSEEQGIVQ